MMVMLIMTLMIMTNYNDTIESAMQQAVITGSTQLCIIRRALRIGMQDTHCLLSLMHSARYAVSRDCSLTRTSWSLTRFLPKDQML